jgi:exonuclease SbcD
MAYSFDEADSPKFFLSVRVEAGKETETTPIPVRTPRRVSRLRGGFESFMEPNAYADKREDYLEIALSDIHLTENPLAILRTRYPNLLSVRQDEALAATGAAEGTFPPAARRMERRDAAEDFAAFLVELYGSADTEKTALFKTLAAEATDAAP